MQQRYYDPIAARFLSLDPIAADANSFNRYWYANNNPFRNIDPDGRDPEWFSEVDQMGNPLGGNAVGGAGITSSEKGTIP